MRVPIRTGHWRLAHTRDWRPYERTACASPQLLLGIMVMRAVVAASALYALDRRTEKVTRESGSHR